MLVVFPRSPLDRGTPPNLIKAEPTDAQKAAGNYAKRKLSWHGLTISIENEKGSTRTGMAGDGTTWSRPMYWAYGYINRSKGMDGDQVDCYLGPDLDAPTVYVVHQRKYGDWDKYDEDKCMIGWPDEDSAKAAYVKQYDDPRFLGPVTAVPAEEFVAKVKATKDGAQMIKSRPFFVLLKAVVGPHLRTANGKTIAVRGYSTRTVAANPDQMDLFTHKEPARPSTPAGPTRAHYATMIRNPGSEKQRVAWLAGPFGSEEEARHHLPAAKAKARELDPWADFDAFGTASREALEHKPGVLNRHIGL